MAYSGNPLKSTFLFRIHHCLPILFCLLTSGFAAPDADTAWKKLFIGYDQGLCVNVFMNRSFGFGAVLIPANTTSLYQHSEITTTTTLEDRWYIDSNEGIVKGGTVLIEGLYRLIDTDKFFLTSFLSMGGRYISRYSNYSYIRYDYIGTTQNREFDKFIIGRFGIIPGIKHEPFSVSMRLGFGGEIGRTDSPEEMARTTDGSSKRFYLMYPYDLVKSISILFAVH